MRQRREFNKQLKGRRCEIKSPVCNGIAQHWHEKLKRSAGGAIVPGADADRQGQEFVASCDFCNGYVEDHSRWARENGWTISRFKADAGSDC